MLDETSIKRQLHRERELIPPYCPNPVCSNHLPKFARVEFFERYGGKKLLRFPYRSTRYRCKDCSRTFTASIFCLYYRQKIWGLNEEIWKENGTGASRSHIAREIRHSEKLVRTRLRIMARFAELKHAKFTEELRIEEPIVYDGLENFSYSQYDPNNINQAVGKNSLFIYDYNFCQINRKGRMSPVQVNRKLKIEKKHGKYPTDAIRTSTRKIFERLLKKASGNLCLFTDNHFQYRRVVEIDLTKEKISHIKVSSKIHRNYRNHLFAVNNIDIQARQTCAAFRRETIAFAKHEIAMQDTFTLYAVYRNYMRPMFWGTHRSDPECSKKSPAMKLGLTKKILSFGDFFTDRVLPTQVELNPDARDRYNRVAHHSRRKIALAPAF